MSRNLEKFILVNRKKEVEKAGISLVPGTRVQLIMPKSGVRKM
jgi:hypothetical protein